VIILTALVGIAALALACSSGGSKTVERLFSGQNNELDVYDLKTNAKTVLIPSDQNNVNGQACAVPDGSGQFIMAEDTNQTDGARQGWGFFNADGSFVRKILEPINEARRTSPSLSAARSTARTGCSSPTSAMAASMRRTASSSSSSRRTTRPRACSTARSTSPPQSRSTTTAR